MTKENITLTILFVLALAFFVGVVSYVFTTKPSEPIQTTGPQTATSTTTAILQGTIADEVNVGLRTISLESGEKLTTVTLAPDAKLFDEYGNSVLLPYFQYSFTVVAKGEVVNDTTFSAHELRIVKTPPIIVLYPRPNDVITSPFALRGKAKISGDKLFFRLIDGDVGIATEGTIPVGSPGNDKFGMFQVTVSFLQPKSEGGILELWESESGPTAGETVSIPVGFKGHAQ